MTPTPEHKKAFERAHEALRRARHIVLATHENPDEDGLGATLAFANYCASVGKPCTAYIIGTPPPRLSFLPKFETLSAAAPQDADMLIAFDYADIKRLKLETLPHKPEFFATFDHHPAHSQQGDVVVSDVAYSSASEVAYHFFVENNIPLTPAMATCLFTGIVADTGGFVHSNTSADAFRVAADLAEKGAATEQVAKRVLGLPSPSAARTIGLALSRLTVDKPSGIMYAYLSSDEVGSWDNVDTLVNSMNHINAAEDGVKCVALFKDKNDGMISVSFRSDPEKGCDAQVLAASFGGGGHTYAAAARIPGTLKDVIAQVLAKAKRNGHVAK